MKKDESVPINLCINDVIYVTRSSISYKRFYGFVCGIRENSINMIIGRLPNLLDLSDTYCVHFVLNRLTYRLEHYALKAVNKLNLAQILMEPPKQKSINLVIMGIPTST